MKDIFFNNRLCVIDTETTGLNPDQHELIQLAVVPLDYDLKVAKGISPLNIHIRPDPDKIAYADPESFTITGTTLAERINQGIDSGTALDLFHEWYDRLNLGPKERLIPIAHNWMFDAEFIRNWMGRGSMELVFHHYARDTMSMALCMDDRAWWLDEDLPYPRLKLRELCVTCGIKTYGDKHDAMEDARLTLELYKFIIRNTAITRNQVKGTG